MRRDHWVVSLGNLGPMMASELEADALQEGLGEDRAEQILMIRESAAGFAPRNGDTRKVRALRYSHPGFDRIIWKEMCGMGWAGLRIPAADGGAELGLQEYCALVEELGAALRPEPLIPCAMAARALDGKPLADLLSGERIVIPALQEQANQIAPGQATTFRGGRLSGRKTFVPLAASADMFLVSTDHGLALVDKDAPGLSLETMQTQDGSHVGTLTFDATEAELLEGDIADAFEEAVLANAAYLLGVMDNALATTLEYLRTRRQFGKPIGSFQALQHRAVDLKIQLELTRASVAQAARIFDSGAPLAQRAAAASRAKARAADVSMLITRQSVQLHGAIGYTDECDIGLFLRKAMTLANTYGSSRLHRSRFARLVPYDQY